MYVPEENKWKHLTPMRHDAAHISLVGLYPLLNLFVKNPHLDLQFYKYHFLYSVGRVLALYVRDQGRTLTGQTKT